MVCCDRLQPFCIRALGKVDTWVRGLLTERWGSTQIVTRGQVYAADKLPGFAALRGGQPVGLVTYRIDGGQCEIISLDSLHTGEGIGSALIRAVRDAAAVARCRRVWLITTNDNLAAIRFYQKRGFRLVAIHRDALELSRRLKPQIPLIGLNGIPLRDEIELELSL
jgi:ribosomal protein S18 acetylase RimI-like enzyme